MSFEFEKNKLLKELKRVVVKVGSAVLTDGNSINLEVMENLVAQVADLHKKKIEVVLVSSGAVAAGRGVLREKFSLSRIPGIPSRQGASAIGQSRLMNYYDQNFAVYDIVSAQVLLTRDDLGNRKRFLNARNTFNQLLSWQVVPIVNENDTVAVQELQFGDNDTLASLLLNLIEADLFINLTSANGVLSENPEKNPEAEIMPYIKNLDELNIDMLCGAKTLVGTGGMYSKLLAAQRAAQLGVPTLILSGKEKNIIARAMQGEAIGTFIFAAERAISQRKFWLAYNQKANGSISIDLGAVKALQEKGRSLLPAGIVAVQGSFDVGDLVHVLAPDGECVGVGLTNYSATELTAVMGLKLSELTLDLDNHYPEAIHRDNLLIGAVV